MQFIISLAGAGAIRFKTVMQKFMGNQKKNHLNKMKN